MVLLFLCFFTQKIESFKGYLFDKTRGFPYVETRDDGWSATSSET